MFISVRQLARFVSRRNQKRVDSRRAPGLGSSMPSQLVKTHSLLACGGPGPNTFCVFIYIKLLLMRLYFILVAFKYRNLFLFGTYGPLATICQGLDELFSIRLHGAGSYMEDHLGSVFYSRTRVVYFVFYLT